MSSYVLTDENGKELLSLGNNYLTFPYNEHTHHKLEISMVKGGTGLYKISDKTYDILPNDVFIIGNKDPHRIILDNNEPITNMVIHFVPEFLWNFFGQRTDYRFLNVFFSRNRNFSNRLDRDNPTTKQICRLLLDIEKEMTEKKFYYDLKVKILMETLLLEILRHYDYFDDGSANEQISRNDIYKINEILHYIDLNIERHLTLKELAQMACVSPAYFSSLFKRYNGITLFEYISRKRIEHANSLITTTSLNLTEIAAMCGFNSSTSFNKAFQRISGCAPSYVRKNAAAEYR